MATPTFQGVDRVLTEDQERLDRPDFDATMQLVDEAVQRQLGALMGYGGGLTSPPKMTLSLVGAPKTITFGPFQYYLSTQPWQDDGVTFKGWKGGFFTFDPAAGSQLSSLDISAVYAAAAAGDALNCYPYVYVRPVATAADTDARRKWTTGDKPVSMKTRSRVRHEFKVATTPPETAINAGWAPILRLYAWSAFAQADPGTPAFHFLSCFDGSGLVGGTGDTAPGFTDNGTTAVQALLAVEAGTETLPALASTAVFNGGPPNKSMGLIQLLHVVRSRLVKLLDTTRASHWYDNPIGVTSTGISKGIRQLVDDNVTQAALVASQTALLATMPTVISFKVSWDSVEGLWVAGVPAGWTVANGGEVAASAHDASFALTLMPYLCVITGVQATPYMYANDINLNGPFVTKAWDTTVDAIPRFRVYNSQLVDAGQYMQAKWGICITLTLKRTV